MSIPWNLSELRSICDGREDARQDLLHLVDSVDRYVGIFRFHLEGARDAFQDLVDTENPIARPNLELLFGTSEKQPEYFRALLASDAHLLGIAHSAKAMFEVFAFLVNALILGSQIPESKCSIYRVEKKLGCCDLRDALRAMTELDAYSYLSGFINTAKHRKLVPIKFQMSTEPVEIGVKVLGFDYNDETFPEIWSTEFLERMLLVKNSILACGHSLNKMASSRDA